MQNLSRALSSILITAGLLLTMVINGFSQKRTIPALSVEALLDSVSQAKGITIINFWSTWCKPCIDEIPDFIEVAEKFGSRDVHLILVSLDTRKLYTSGDLEKWIAKKGWKANFWWLNETNADRYCPAIDEQWSGVIPVTLVVRNDTGFRRFTEASMSKEELMQVIIEAKTSTK